MSMQVKNQLDFTRAKRRSVQLFVGAPLAICIVKDESYPDVRLSCAEPLNMMLKGSRFCI